MGFMIAGMLSNPNYSPNEHESRLKNYEESQR
jgi:hypothetical protein